MQARNLWFLWVSTANDELAAIAIAITFQNNGGES